MKKATKGLVIIILLIILIFTGIKIYESSIKNNYALSVSIQSSCVSPGIGTNITIQMTETGHTDYSLNHGLIDAICIFYIGNSTFNQKWIPNSVNYYSNARSLSREACCNYSTFYRISSLGEQVPINSLSGTGTTTLTLHWNGTVQVTPINCCNKIGKQYELALPGNYVVIPSINFKNTNPCRTSYYLSNDMITVKGPEIGYENNSSNISLRASFIGHIQTNPIQLEFVNSFVNTGKNNNSVPFLSYYKNLTINSNKAVYLPKYNKTMERNFIVTNIYEKWNNFTWKWREIRYAI